MDKKTLMRWSDDEVRSYAEASGISVDANDPKRKVIDLIIAHENRTVTGTTHGFEWSVNAHSVATVANATRIGRIDPNKPGGMVEYGKMLLGDEQFERLAEAMGDDLMAVTLCVSDIDAEVGRGNADGSAPSSKTGTQG